MGEAFRVVGGAPRPGAGTVLLVAVVLAARLAAPAEPPPRAAPETVPPPVPPPAATPAATAPAAAPPPPPGAPPAAGAPGGKDYWAALAEVTAFNVLPQLWNRLVLRKEMGQVSWGTWRENLSRGFAYDPDKFVTNVLSHPQHGGLYYAAARANGLDLWESALFTAFGSLTWEYFGEASRPSTNDLIMTSLSGISSGETSYRIADLVFDDTATGFSRFLHEFAGLAVSPGRAFQRLFSGDAFRVGPNPPDRKPGWLSADLRGGGLYVESDRPSVPASRKGRATVSWDLRYGDPFEKDVGKPFSSFRLEAEATTAKNFLSRVTTEGNLAGWRLDDSPARRTYLAATLGFTFDNVDLEFGGVSAGLEASSRLPAGKGYDVVPRAQLLSAYSAVQTSEESVKATYRNYDWGLGGGLSVGARLRKEGRDVARLDVTDLFLYTVNGPTRWNEVRIARGAAFLPVSPAFALGAEYAFHQHRNVFPGGQQLRTSRQVRALVSWTVFSGRP